MACSSCAPVLRRAAHPADTAEVRVLSGALLLTAVI
eukprot:gene22302-14918_t